MAASQDDGDPTGRPSGSANSGKSTINYPPNHSTQTVPSDEKQARHTSTITSTHSINAFVKTYRQQFATAAGSIVCTASTFPLDFAKSRMQSYNQTFLHTVADAWKAEGPSTFWRGVVPPLISTTMVRVFSFTGYRKTKYFFDNVIFQATGQSPLAIANAPNTYPNVYTMLCFGLAGATSGAVITTLSCPFELIKLNEQLAGKTEREAAEQSLKDGKTPGAKSSTGTKTGTLATGMRIWRERGLLGFYAGYRLHLLRDTYGTALYFMTYESVKQLMANARGKSPTSPGAVAVAGGVCGILTAFLIYPIDVAKTVYQKRLLAAPRGVHVPVPSIDVFKIGGYRGLGVSVVRSCISNMIFFSQFEWAKRYIDALG